MKVLLKGYRQGILDRAAIEEFLGIDKTRFLALLRQYRHAPDTFSVAYRRETPTRLPAWVESEIEKELILAKNLIDSGVTSTIRIRQSLRGTAEDLGPSGFDSFYGCGLVNTSRATGVGSNNEPGDTIPPITRIELSGLQGNGDWYRSDVTVELTAVDNPGGSESPRRSIAWTLARLGISIPHPSPSPPSLLDI